MQDKTVTQAIFQKFSQNLKTSSRHPPPCQQIEKLIYTFRELNWLAHKWINDGTNNGTDKIFEILIELSDGTYMEITQTKSYDVQTLVGNTGGYIGLFLGYRYKYNASKDVSIHKNASSLYSKTKYILQISVKCIFLLTLVYGL